MSRPNIVLITTDQQRYDTLRPHAPDFLRTPHLDLLRHEGVQFERAYAQTPICVPSRVCLLTGQSPLRHGMTSNGATGEVAGRTGTLPALVAEQGYATYAVGKMHFNPPRARHGFDEILLPDDYYRQLAESGSPLQPMRHGLGQNELYPGVATVPEAMTLTSWIAEQSVNYIRDRRDPTCPFFLWVSFSKPHPPLDPPEPYASMYADAAIPPPVYGSWSGADAPPAFARYREKQHYDLIPPEVITAARAAYYGLITHIDFCIGRVMSALQDVGLLGDTTVLFTSDHGEYLGDHHAGGKIMLHDASARVPMIVRPAPSTGSELFGTSSDALVTHTDVAATIVAAAGGEVPDNWDGHDLLAVADGSTPRRRRLVGLAHDRGTPAGRRPPAPAYLGVVTDGWKYLWYPEGAMAQLFDLENDPLELTDLAASRPEVAARLRTELVEELTAAAGAGGLPWIEDWIAGGELIEEPPRGDTTRERRANSWPGLHTEFYPVDVRH